MNTSNVKNELAGLMYCKNCNAWFIAFVMSMTHSSHRKDIYFSSIKCIFLDGKWSHHRLSERMPH